MPLVPPPTAPPPDLLARATERWERLTERRPELEPAVELQGRVLAVVAEAHRTLERGRLPRLSLPARYLAAKLARGVPVFAGEPIPIPVAVLGPAILRIADELAAGGGGDRARAIGAAIAGRSMDPATLLAASLARDQSVVRALAGQAGVAPDLLWLAAEMTASPFAHLLLSTITTRAGGEPVLGEALAAWDEGTCPACGSWPVAAEVARGHRVLRCAFCSAGWELTTYACVYCGEAGEKFVTAAVEDENKSRRIEACANCGGYLKTIDVDDLSPFPLVAITDLETMDLDVHAMQHNYMRPAARQFQKR